MRRFPLISWPIRAAFLALSLAVFGMSSVPSKAAPKSMEENLRARQRTAQALADKRQWSAAFQTLAAARDLINTERRRVATPVRKPLPPSLRQEAKALSAWLAAKNKRRKPGEPLPLPVVQEYRRRQTALQRKAAMHAPPKQSGAKVKQAILRLGLLLADLDDTAAAIHRQKGDTAEAMASRQEAGRRRLKLYSEAGKKAEADAWAARLAKSGAGDPTSLATVAEYQQAANRFGPAAQYWRQAITLLEKDRTTKSALESQLYYRQLAYCYDRLGKSADRDAARAAAARLEAAHAARNARPRP